MTEVAGVDAYRKGWVAVLTRDGRFTDAVVFPDARAMLVVLAELAAVAVDIPIGLVDGRRGADAAARRLVGPRRSSVFDAPPRDVVEAPSYEEARRISVARYGRSVSAQSYRGLRARILEVDALVAPGDPVFEVHPEVSFWALAGRPLAFPKRSWNGQLERRRLLADAGIVLPDTLSAAGAVPVDDVLDAAAAAWSAGRLARGEAVSLPDPPERDERGRSVAIWY